MTNDSDIIVIGGGPIGLFAAIEAAQAGTSVTMLNTSWEPKKAAPPNTSACTGHYTTNSNTQPWHTTPESCIPNWKNKQDANCCTGKGCSTSARERTTPQKEPSWDPSRRWNNSDDHIEP